MHLQVVIEGKVNLSFYIEEREAIREATRIIEAPIHDVPFVIGKFQVDENLIGWRRCSLTPQKVQRLYELTFKVQKKGDP